MVSQSEGNFDGIRTKKFVGGETLEPEKRLEFIIDWCPLGSASRSVVEIRRIQHRNEIARAGVEKIFHRHFPNCSVEFEFAFRDDGLMILAIQVPERTPFASLRHAAREILDEIKANALDHIHHHHHHRFKAMIESGRNTHWRSIKDFFTGKHTGTQKYAIRMKLMCGKRPAADTQVRTRPLLGELMFHAGDKCL